jgi:hypothetical protein
LEAERQAVRASTCLREEPGVINRCDHTWQPGRGLGHCIKIDLIGTAVNL